jgi:PAS domain-containing protein
MPVQPLELILGRQFVDTISLPAFIVDTEGNLLFYNESAETVFGLKFGETGMMRLEEWATIFTPYNQNGEPILPEGLPLVQTLQTKKPNSGSFYIKSMQGNDEHIQVTAFPIVGRPDRFLGAMAIFWTLDE